MAQVDNEHKETLIVKISYQPYPKGIWHSDCTFDNRSCPMKEVSREAKRTLMHGMLRLYEERILSSWRRQSAYGHRANKATWLYYNGTSQPFELRWERPRGTHQVGCQCRQGIRKTEPWRNKPTLGKREANATPLEFRDELLRLAMMANNSEINNK